MTSVLRPDLDMALAEWRERVEADGRQVERLRELPDGPDFYGPIASNFKANPYRTGEPMLEKLMEMVRPDETWLDIGAGGGRLALPIALKAKSVIAVEPSPGMVSVLREGMSEHNITNIEIHESRWDGSLDVEADCSLMSMVGNDIADIGPFIDRMEKATRRMCTFINLDRPPPSAMAGAWQHVHGEPRALLPAIPEFLALLLAKRRLFEVRLIPRSPMTFAGKEDILATARRQTWVKVGSEKDRRLREYIDATVSERAGRFSLAWEPGVIAIVTWAPR